ncbi:phosphate ABC transporter substrate-binding protein PstS [Nonomuraea sp. NPDC050536]|uniref:phosphate ABC transporter substrate-binding protein PstS n=1 Tax=Nonomuraea sp. NPDC050536 TaxID=3364366 RepID=UPI0037CB32D1
MEVVGPIAAATLALTSCSREPNVATGPVVTIVGSGSAEQVAAVNAWRTEFGQVVPSVRVDYRPVGSEAGVRDFISGAASFAGSDFVMSPQQQAQADKRCRGRAFHLPMLVSPIAVVYNLPDVPDLRLSPKALTGIFSGKITTWTDPAIAADNPGARLPGTGIHAFHRSDATGTSESVTTFLAETGGWPYPPSTRWPAAGGAGADGPSSMTDAVLTTENSIGYVEYGYASGAELRTAKVRDAAGQFVALTPESASRSLAGAHIVGRNGDLAVKLDLSTREPGAYPLVRITYEIACAKGSPPLLLGFLNYATSNAGQSNLSLVGYAPLPPDLIAKVRSSLAFMT